VSGTSALGVRIAVYSGARDDSAANIAALETELTTRKAPTFEIARFSDARDRFAVFDQPDALLPIGDNQYEEVAYQTRADTRSYASAIDFVADAFTSSLVVGTTKPDSLIDLTADPSLMTFTSSDDVLTFARRWATESAYLQRPGNIYSAEEALLEACRVTVTELRKCYLGVRAAMDVARVASGGRRTLRDGSSSSSRRYLERHRK